MIERLDTRFPRAALSRLTEMHVEPSGLVRQRGATKVRFGDDLSNLDGERWVWLGSLLPGQRGLAFSLETGFTTGLIQRFNSALNGFAALNTKAAPAVDAYVVVGNVLYVGTKVPTGSATILYGGSLKNAWTAVTNLNRTAGSRVVTRAAGGFTANVDKGMIVGGWEQTGAALISASAPGAGHAVVESVDSDTQVTMDRPSPSTDVATGSFMDFDSLNALFGLPGAIPAAAAGRLLLLNGNKLYFTNGPDPSTGRPRTSQGPARNVHEFPVDAQGIALATLKDRAMVFTATGLYGISNLASEIVDGSGNPAHAIEEISSKSVALGQRGIVRWQGALIVPCRDGIYAFDGYNEPVKLSASVPWAEMVRFGMQLGFATIFKERYILPLKVSMGGSDTYWQLVLRLDGQGTDQGTVFPTTVFSLPTSCYAVATTPNPDELLGVGAKADGVLDLGQIFTADTTGADHTGSLINGGVGFTTALVPLGDKSIVRRVRVRYTATSDGAAGTVKMGGAVVGVAGVGPVDLITDGVTRWVAMDATSPGECSAAAVALTFSSSTQPLKDIVIHAIELHYRAARVM
jgi:hypothetical protein